MNTKEYEILIHELLCQSGRTDGRQCSWFEREACTILVKIVITAFSTLHFIPGSSRFKNEFWDISSLAALSRSIVESYCALRYIAVENPEEDERTFRKILWQFQMEQERLRMLEATVPESPQFPSVVVARDALKHGVESSKFFCSLGVKHKAKLLKGKDSAIKSNVDLCKDAGIRPDLYRGIYKYLSSLTHASPFGLSALYYHKAGQEDTREIVSLITNWVTGFLCFSIRDFAEVFPDQKEYLPQNIVEQIRKWEGVFAWDFTAVKKMIHEQ